MQKFDHKHAYARILNAI